jgi:hypothetical protein
LYGSGYNSVKGTVLGDCIERGETTNIINEITREDARCNSNGQCTHEDIQLANSAASLRNALEVNAKGSFGLGVFGGDARARFYNERASHHSSLFLYIKMDVVNHAERLAQYKLTDAASRLLAQNNHEFHRRCGDQFVASIVTGGQFIAILEITTSSEEDRKELETSLDTTGLGWGASLEVAQKLTSISKDHKIGYTVIKNGSISPIPKMTPDEIIKAATNFPTEVSNRDGAPWVRAVTTVSYDAVVDRPGGELVDLTAQGLLLEDMADQMDDVLNILKKVEHIIQYPDMYEPFNRTRLFELKQALENIRASLARAARVCGLNPENCVMPNILFPQDRLPAQKAKLYQVVDLVVRTQSHQGAPTHENGVKWHPLDLNSHHGGKHIYVGCKESAEGNPVRDVGFLSMKRQLKKEEVQKALKEKGFEHCSGQDLSKGAGGRYIYMGWSKNGSKAPVTNVDFVESSSEKAPHKNGWTIIPQDLCEGGGGSYIWCYLKRGSNN